MKDLLFPPPSPQRVTEKKEALGAMSDASKRILLRSSRKPLRHAITSSLE